MLKGLGFATYQAKGKPIKFSDDLHIVASRLPNVLGGYEAVSLWQLSIGSSMCSCIELQESCSSPSKGPDRLRHLMAFGNS